MIILDNKNIIQLKQTKELGFFEKPQASPNSKNYFLNPSVGLVLYGAQVRWVDRLGTNLSFGFSKKDHLPLLLFLRHVNESLATIFKQSLQELKNPDYNLKISPLYYEKGDYFYLKCRVPTHKNQDGKTVFTVQVTDSVSETFVVPRVKCEYHQAIIQISNICSTTDFGDLHKTGFNLELRSVRYNSVK
jgi:hypothetical protein